ncbi:MAG: glutathione-dependent formaldehyde dehydrogenase [Acidobacteria bacterium]|nr:glutathione-dependent formaldehyde dehydrogenase [Acidobacteriota bacterium]
MKAICWYGKKDVRVESVPDPEILNPRDVIVKVTSTAICGSDLHIYDGYIPMMKNGDILGHEFMGEIVERGSEVRERQIGDRVIVPFAISCGSCFFCNKDLFSLCDNTNPNAHLLQTMYGKSGAGLFGYSHLYGGYAGGQAEYVRVPFADVGCLPVPASIPDEKALFLTDIFPTGFMAADNCDIEEGDTVAVWGCGPVGQFALRSASILGAERVIAIDSVPERLEMARRSGALVIDESANDVRETLDQMTGGRGPDACIDAVGMEAHGDTVDAFYDSAKQKLRLEIDRSHALRQAIVACGKGGTVSIPGVYGGFLDKFPLGSAFAKGLTLKMGQTHVHHYMKRLLGLIEEEVIDPSFVITHRMRLDEAPDGYSIFAKKEDECIKIVLQP